MTRKTGPNLTVNRVQRFINLCDQGKSPRQISEITGLSIKKVKQVMCTLQIKPRPTDEGESICGSNIIHLPTLTGRKNENKKPESDKSERKERKCNRSECGRVFISQHFGHRNCGCNYGETMDKQMEFA